MRTCVAPMGDMAFRGATLCAAAVLAACGGEAQLTLADGMGAQPKLPPPNQRLIPVVDIAPADGINHSLTEQDFSVDTLYVATTIFKGATDYDGRVVVGKLNVDDNPGTAGRFSIRGIPTLLLFKGGQIVEQVVGLADKDSLKKLLEKHV